MWGIKGRGPGRVQALWGPTACLHQRRAQAAFAGGRSFACRVAQTNGWVARVVTWNPELRKHAHLTCTKKLQIFSACVVSRLMYSLHTAWLCKADLRKIDAFQARCLRSILGIPHSFISRVRNETVLQEAGTEKLSNHSLAPTAATFGAHRATSTGRCHANMYFP